MQTTEANLKKIVLKKSDILVIRPPVEANRQIYQSHGTVYSANGPTGLRDEGFLAPKLRSKL